MKSPLTRLQKVLAEASGFGAPMSIPALMNRHGVYNEPGDSRGALESILSNYVDAMSGTQGLGDEFSPEATKLALAMAEACYGEKSGIPDGITGGEDLVVFCKPKGGRKAIGVDVSTGKIYELTSDKGDPAPMKNPSDYDAVERAIKGMG